MSNVVANAGILSQAEPFEPSQQTLDYVSRVETDGGFVVDQQLVDAFYNEEVAKSRLTGSLRQAYAEQAGIKVATEPTVDKIYDMGDSDRDDDTSVDRVSQGFDMNTGNHYLGQRDLSTWSAFAWVKLDTDAGSQNGVIGQNNSARRGFELRPSSTIGYRDSGANFYSQSTGADLVNGNWHFVGMSGTGSDIDFVYNGSIIGSETVSANAELRLDSVGTALNQSLDGLIDLFAVYTAVLSGTDWAGIFNATKKFYGY